MAIALRRPPKGCIHHTDRGSQYCSHDYQKILRKHGLTASMNGKGNGYDNAAVLRRENSPPDYFLILLTISNPSRRKWSGAETGRPAERSKSPYSNTSTVSKTRVADTQPWAGKAPWPSNERPINISTRPEQNRDRSIRLNGRLLAAGDRMVEPFGLTSARWQVLGAISLSPVPETVVRLARNLGLNRQGVQRIVGDLVAEGFIEMKDNPHHRSARLVLMTPKGQSAYTATLNAQAPWVNRLGEGFDAHQIREVEKMLDLLKARLEETQINF